MNEKLKCKICNKKFKHLGSHLWHKHKLLARDYKERFGLPYKMGLVSEGIREKQQEANNCWKNKVRRTKTITNIDRNVDINLNLYKIAEEYLK